MARVFQLLLIDLRAALHRLRHDLGKELAVLAASLILLATFAYVFNDFLNVQIAAVAMPLRDALAQAACAVTLVVVALAAARTLQRSQAQAASTRHMARMLGESMAIIQSYERVQAAIILLIWHGLGWGLSCGFLLRPSWAQALSLEALMLGITAASFAWARRRHSQPSLAPAPSPSPPSGSRRRTLWLWRLRQHGGRNRAYHGIYAVALVLLGVGFAIWGGGGPLVAPVAAALIAGILIAAILALALAEDLRHAWMERALGVSHDEIVQVYLQSAVLLAAPAAVIAALLGLWASPPGVSIVLSLKPAAVLVVTPLFAPYMLFQIDARRPGINIVGIIIVGLFLGTAVFAHWLAVLVPILAKAAVAPNQAGRFYRA